MTARGRNQISPGCTTFYRLNDSFPNKSMALFKKKVYNRINRIKRT